MREPCGSKSGVQRLPPMKLTVTGSVSSLLKETSACVGLPLTSLMPKISAAGKEAETVTARFGDVDGASTSSAAYRISWRLSGIRSELGLWGVQGFGGYLPQLVQRG